MPLTKVTSGMVNPDPSNASNLSSGSVPVAQLGNAPATDLTPLEDDIALIGFKVAANGSLAKYNLVDQTIDDFQDASGIDASASTEEVRDSSGKYYAATVSTGATTAKTASGSWTSGAADTSIKLLVVGGGGGGGTGSLGGGGGAGGLVYIDGYTVTPSTTYNITVGSGGGENVDGGNSVFDSSGTTLTITGNGGGSGGWNYPPNNYGRAGGSSGGSGGADGGASPQSANQTATFGSYTNVGFGNNGATGGGNNTRGGGGGGGAGAAGAHDGSTGWGANGGNGGTGKDYSSVYGTGYGASGWFAGGGGGGAYGGSGGSGGEGGGACGSGGNGNSASSNTGGGGGGGGDGGSLTGGSGGSGIVLIKTSDIYAASMTLVSNSTTAEATPTKGDMVMTYTDGVGTATLNTDLKGYVSRDNGTTWTQGTLASQGTSGGHKIVTFHDLDISGQPSGAAMRYKIETLNQGAAKSTRIQAVSLGWS